MFGKREKVEITPDDPQLMVKYAGMTETFVSGGKGCMEGPVQKIWDNSMEEKRMQRCFLLVNPSGIALQGVENKSWERKFDIRSVSYCSAEVRQHERVFAWIYQNSVTKKLECHAVVCSSVEKAKTLAVLMARAFQIAYRDWKGDQQKKTKLKPNNVGIA